MSALSARLTWPWRRSRIALAFSPRVLLARRTGEGARIVRREVPPGLLVPSAAAPNIRSVREVAQLAAAMVEDLSGRGATAAVLLPDLSVSSAVVPPARGGERDLAADLGRRLGTSASGLRTDFWRGRKGELLGAAVLEAVVRQYEQVIEAAECRVGWIDAASLARIPSWADASQSDPGITLVEALLYHSHYVLALFRGGELIDLRTRLRAGDDCGAVAEEIRRLPAMYGDFALGTVALSGEGASDCARILSEACPEARVSSEGGGEEKALETAISALLLRS